MYSAFMLYIFSSRVPNPTLGVITQVDEQFAIQPIPTVKSSQIWSSVMSLHDAPHPSSGHQVNPAGLKEPLILGQS